MFFNVFLFLLKDLKIDTYRAGGAGGQHVNTTDSAVRVTHIPSGLVVESQSQRSQAMNRQQAIATIRTRLFQLEVDRQLSTTHSSRKLQVMVASFAVNCLFTVDLVGFFL